MDNVCSLDVKVTPNLFHAHWIPCPGFPGPFLILAQDVQECQLAKNTLPAEPVATKY